MVNSVIARTLSRNCPQRIDHWTLDHEEELKGLLRPKDECEVEVLLIGQIHDRESPCFGTSRPVTVFDLERFQHLGYDQLKLHCKELVQIFQGRNSRYFVPSEAQSAAISTHFYPDFSPERLTGPYSACYCSDCSKTANPKHLPFRRKQPVQLVQHVIGDFMSGDNERVYNIPEYLRERGQYVPTEEDWLEYMEAKSTYERVAVLDRLNKEKAEKEAWMCKN
ncbi:hypothetical protein K491DRAFT_723316 [Lophiostoma macrostomum CBS 122681]|uniref:Uncharacterized protein n=1 Tax=Lophiostoma macrostomum CBS 122681 TaxID=1314788 RepID=A0A6A6SN28_9PLEO|nr:hypothetical protein K491DRAFT_723316 [Lophiostoma macrostomum CBS 122681]